MNQQSSFEQGLRWVILLFIIPNDRERKSDGKTRSNNNLFVDIKSVIYQLVYAPYFLS